ncbi:hypothetical protein SO802_033366 [Lithocarpus litseifolius]|uniref:Uncharacterized protein n=1 Tax=Lithocarpus litseifolius TaxID=425828 RepID=A0AAW2BCZ8_9ROSI
MEQKASNFIINIDPNPENNIKTKQVSDYEKKKRGPMHLVKVALFMIRTHKSNKPKPLPMDVAPSKDSWKGLVASMRPLHLQSDQSSPPPSIVEAPKPIVTSPMVEYFEDLHSPTYQSGASSSSSSEDGMSRYASAVNLQELNKDNDENDEDEDGGDEMIDAKAEEFIAQFYQQMKLQQMDLVDDGH